MKKAGPKYLQLKLVERWGENRLPTKVISFPKNVNHPSSWFFSRVSWRWRHFPWKKQGILNQLYNRLILLELKTHLTFHCKFTKKYIRFNMNQVRNSNTNWKTIALFQKSNLSFCRYFKKQQSWKNWCLVPNFPIEPSTRLRVPDKLRHRKLITIKCAKTIKRFVFDIISEVMSEVSERDFSSFVVSFKLEVVTVVLFVKWQSSCFFVIIIFLFDIWLLEFFLVL